MNEQVLLLFCVSSFVALQALTCVCVAYCVAVAQFTVYILLQAAVTDMQHTA